MGCHDYWQFKHVSIVLGRKNQAIDLYGVGNYNMMRGNQG